MKNALFFLNIWCVKLLKTRVKEQKKTNLVRFVFCGVNPLVQNSNSFLEDLRRLNQLKDRPTQDDEDIPKYEKESKSTQERRIISKVKR